MAQWSGRLVGCGVVLASVVATSAPALADEVRCGSVVTTDITLTSDLLGCPGDGLIVGADGITVDLGGHVVSGSLLSGDDPDQVGVDNSGGYDRVTIRNGSVEDFRRGGVRLVGADANRVQGLRMTSFGDFGVLLSGGISDTLVAGNQIGYSGGFGISVVGVSRRESRGNRIVGNTVSSSLTAGIAVQSGRVAGTVIDSNEVARTSADMEWSAAVLVGREAGDIRDTTVVRNDIHDNFGAGIYSGTAATSTRVRGNRLVDDSFAAVEVAGAGAAVTGNAFDARNLGMTDVAVRVDRTAVQATVTGNSIRGAALAGVEDRGRSTRIERNRIDGIQPGYEYWGGGWAGILVRPKARGGAVSGNVVVRQSESGIVVRGRAMTLTGNVVRQTTYSDGIRVEPDAAEVRLIRNTVDGAGDDGIDIAAPSTTVSGNGARDNTDLGIIAVAGVTDAGGNWARGNGNPVQCVGVICSTGPLRAGAGAQT